MPLLAAAATSIYLTFNSGQLAGMDNVLLRPKATAGIVEDFAPAFAPLWLNHVDAYTLYGNAETGTGYTSNDFQEVRAALTSLYRFYDKDQVLHLDSGLYSEFSQPLHHYLPRYAPSANNSYALEENEKTSFERLFGADLHIGLDYDRLATSLHTVLFFSGNRVGPNLLGYQPLLGFDWTNTLYVIGTEATPKVDIYLSSKFWFARKSGTSLFNSHDGLAGTKREIDLTIGLGYHPLPSTELYIQSYGYNNINRGSDASKPQGYTDGFVAGVRLQFK